MARESEWAQLEERTRQILGLRMEGFTLDDVAIDLGITRERVRQIQKAGMEAIQAGIEEIAVRAIEGHFEHNIVISEAEAAVLLRVEDRSEIQVMLSLIGCGRPRIFGSVLNDWWSMGHGDLLIDVLGRIVDSAPFEDSELVDSELIGELPAEFPLRELLSSDKSPLQSDESGNWVRRRSKNADLAFLMLSRSMYPLSINELTTLVGRCSERALAETLRRNPERFFQIRPEGTWALCEWEHLGLGFNYRDATEAVVAIVSELGPLGEAQLTAECLKRYPVTPWRVSQCLYSLELGTLADGRIDLTSRGAALRVAKEPTRPSYMAEVNHTIAVELPVTRDVLRGSGTGVSMWLTWRLGLHSYPSVCSFLGEHPLYVRRSSSGASVSTVRGMAVALGLELGCRLVLVLDLSKGLVSFRANCGNGCSHLSAPLHTLVNDAE